MGAAILAGILGGLPGCRPRPQTPAPAANPAPEKPQATIRGQAKGIRLEQVDEKGRPLFKVVSAASAQSQAESTATLSDTTVTIYDEGEPSIVVSAPNTKVKAETRELVMWGGIKAKVPEENVSFEVGRLTWSYDSKQFTGTGNVRLAQPPLSMRANNISGRTPVKKVNLEGGVLLDVTPKPGSNTR